MRDRAEIEAFWDAVHAGEDPALRSDTPADWVFRAFEACGFGRSDIKGPCLEIGPGRGQVFVTLPRPRYAIDVSPLNRNRIAPEADGTYAPDADPVALGCNFALAFLVMQHCEDDEVRRLFKWAHTALAPGGVFWLQTAQWRHRPTPDVGEILIGGGARQPMQFHQWLVDAGFPTPIASLMALNNGMSDWTLWRAVKP